MQACQVLGLSFPHELSLSSDGSLLAVATHGGLVRIFRGSDGAEVRTLVAPGVVLIAAALSPDGASVVAGGRDGSLRRWRLSDGALLWTVAAHAAQVASVRFAPGGATFASIATDGGGRLSLAADGSPIATFGHYKNGNTVAFSPDGQWLASGGEGHVGGGGIIDSASQVSIWHAADAQFVRSLNYSSLGGPPVAFSPDSQTLAIAAGTVFKLVHVSDGTDAKLFTSYPNGPSRIEFTPDGATLVANGSGSTSLWSVASGTFIRQIPFSSELVEGLAVMPDGLRVVSGVNGLDSQAIHVNRLADATEVWNVTGFNDVSSLSYSAAGLLVSGSYDTHVHVWNPDGTPLHVLPGGAIPSLGLFLGDGSSLVVSGNGLFVVRTSDGQTLTQTAGGAGLIATSADGSLLATATYPKTVALYALPGLTPGPTFNDSTTTVYGLALSPDGSLLASGESNGEVIVRRLGADAAAPLRFTANAGGTYAMAFSPDGGTLATAGADGSVRLWQTPDGTPGLVLGGGTKQTYAVAFSPDGTSLAAGFEDGVVRTWRVADGAAGTSLVGHTASIDAVAFSADGKRIASGGSDATIRVWCLP
jgi:WD40 repeat protein